MDDVPSVDDVPPEASVPPGDDPPADGDNGEGPEDDEPGDDAEATEPFGVVAVPPEVDGLAPTMTGVGVEFGTTGLNVGDALGIAEGTSLFSTDVALLASHGVPPPVTSSQRVPVTRITDAG